MVFMGVSYKQTCQVVSFEGTAGHNSQPFARATCPQHTLTLEALCPSQTHHAGSRQR